jgi:hypothetical protein
MRHKNIFGDTTRRRRHTWVNMGASPGKHHHFQQNASCIFLLDFPYEQSGKAMPFVVPSNLRRQSAGKRPESIPCREKLVPAIASGYSYVFFKTIVEKSG